MRLHADRLLLCSVVCVAGALGCGVEDDLDTDLTQALAAPPAPKAQSCAEEADCPGGLACVSGTCQPCAAHGQCASDVCDQNAATAMGPGACVSEASVVYVDANAYLDCATGDGTRANPVCQVRDALPFAVGGRYAIRVYPGYYRPLRVTSRTVYVFGPGDGSAVMGEEDLSTGARASVGATLVLDGLDFDVGVLTGVLCEDSSLEVRRATVRGDSYGVRAINCNLDLDRVRVIGAGRSGLVIDGTGTYHIANSYFSGGDAQAVVLGGSSTGVFQFNTVLGGGEIQPGGIDCGTTPRTICNSIVIGSSPAAGGAQTVGACVHRRVVVGSGDTRTLPGLIARDPALDEQGRLLPTPANKRCCIDRGDEYVSSLYRDFFGTPRLQGESNDIGAHEVAQP